MSDNYCSAFTKYEVPTLDDLPKIPEPYLYRVVVRPLQPRKKTAGGIILTSETQRDESYFQVLGVVVAIGPTAFRAEDSDGRIIFGDDTPKKGDLVVFGKHAGMSIYKEHLVKDEDGKERIERLRFIIIKDSDVIMKIGDPTGYRTEI